MLERIGSRPLDFGRGAIERRHDGTNLRLGQRALAEPHGEREPQVVHRPEDLGRWTAAVRAARFRQPCEDGVDDGAVVLQKGGTLRRQFCPMPVINTLRALFAEERYGWVDKKLTARTSRSGPTGSPPSPLLDSYRASLSGLDRALRPFPPHAVT